MRDGVWSAGVAVLAATFLGVVSTVAQGQTAAPEVTVTGLDKLDFREVIQSAKNQVFPAVVYLRCLRESHDGGERSAVEVTGSGVIISSDGEVLTNWHVVDKALEIRGLLSDGRHFSASLIGSDKDTDLALIKFDIADKAELPLPYAKLGDSTSLKEGDFVMAMGAPWGLNRSVSIGIISCVERLLPGTSEYSLWLQTDAAISPGNSGGPLVATSGRVIGLNTRGVTYGGDMGFAVPSVTIEHLLPQLREHGRVDWSWTGLQLQAMEDFDQNIYFQGKPGIIVAGTDPQSPARRAGLQPRDRILAIDGKPIAALTPANLPAARRRFGLLTKDQPVKLTILREDKRLEVPLTPRRKGAVEGKELDCPRWDMTVKAINRFDNPDLHFQQAEGVFIYATKMPGNAGNAGLQTRDILVKIDGETVKSLEDVKAVHKRTLANMDTKHRVLVVVLRDGLMRHLVLDFKRDYARQ